MNVFKFVILKMLFGWSLRPNIKRLARFSSYAYSKQNTIKHLKHITTFPDITGVRAFTDTDNTLIITCRGTRNIRDWKINFNCLPVKHPYVAHGRIHHGYLKETWKSKETPQFKHLENFISNSNRNILLTGHSSGGAKAIILSII